MNSLVRAVLLGAVCIVGLPHAGQAQRQVKRLNSFNFQYGHASRGAFYRFGYSRFTSDKLRLDVLALRESGRINTVKTGPATPYFGYDLGFGIAPQLFRVKEVVFVHTAVQLHGRYDRVRRPASEALPQAVAQGFSAGPEVGLTADVYLTDWLSLSGQASQGYLAFRPPLTSWPRYYGGGLQLHFR